MPVELGLEFMAVIRSNLGDTEREFVDDGIDEVDRVRLIVSVVDFQGANARGDRRSPCTGIASRVSRLCLRISDPCE